MKQKSPKWFVSRQSYWPDGELVVEIAGGGRDYANPDMLFPQWVRLGEGQEFSDPREAATSAITIAQAWRHADPDAEITVRHGTTCGFTVPFEESSDEEVLAWAEHLYQTLPKCDRCGDVLHEVWRLHDDLEEYVFCSETCALCFWEDAEEENNEVA